ncbi:MAG TPA: ATP-binding protein [Thermoleophilia bacterium]|nr:ATP-binding protein [Thermoleophilia bacterium]
MRLFTLTLPLAPSQAAELRFWVWRRLLGNGVPEQTAIEVVLGAQEAFNLALAHAGAIGEVVVRMSILDDVVYLTASDDTAGPDPDQLAEAELSLVLLRRLMDDVRLESTGEGLTVRMVKRIDAARPAVA